MSALIAVLATISFLAALAVLAARLRLFSMRLGPAAKPRNNQPKEPTNG